MLRTAIFFFLTQNAPQWRAGKVVLVSSPKAEAILCYMT
jgi:hypothetical protein